MQQSALSHYENGARRPSFTNLRRLATTLDVSTDYLVGKASASKGGEERLARDIARLRPVDQKIVRALVHSLLRDQSR